MTMQELLEQMFARHGVDRYPTIEANALKLVEEVGEVARAVLRGDHDALVDELADVTMSVAALFAKLDTDMETHVAAVVARQTRKTQ